jgi:RNA polymerase sigma-70 factor, ECF subfamily
MVSLSTTSPPSNHESWLLAARNAPCCVHVGIIYMDSPDEELVMHAKGGDRDAFTTLFLGYKGEIYACLKQIVQDDKIAEDLWQDTYIRALLRIQSLKEPSRFKPWVLMIAKRLALDCLRQNKRGRTLSLEAEDANISNLIAGNADPQLMVGEDSVQSILAEIDPVHRNVLLLSVDGYSRAEIAQQLKLAESTVTTYLSRAREQFRQRYRMISHTGDNISSEGKNEAKAHNASELESLDKNDHSQENCNPNENQKEI